MKKNKQNGAERFNNYYESIYGARWEELKKSFVQKPDYFEIKGKQSCTPRLSLHSEINNGLLAPYYIDRASLFPVKALDIIPGHNVLDMCAAPGGKTLLITLAAGESGAVTANDRSAARRARLVSVLDVSLPAELRKVVKLTGHDASLWGVYEKNVYDRILLDAPCSSERHVYMSEFHLKQWTPSRIKQLASRQFAMLAAALDAVKPLGKIVYSTCSISREENDGIIEKLFKKRKGLFEVESIESRDEIFGSEIEAEKTEFGYYIMPDRNNGAGPIFFAVIVKLSAGG
ncbi:MAG: RsmB/NOP family class I SAM-dependent RNA methyltransferase [Spirochaetes bacterium]|nr:RsmB/NOP family class I SAM-dependent RNA methyltransferase [Spirochaetota bacterium]